MTNKKCYVCETGDVESSHIEIIFDTKHKAEKWVKHSQQLQQEWQKFDNAWNQKHNPDGKNFEETSWSTEEAKYYEEEFKKICSDRESDYYSFKEYGIV
jgi:hypothetical protein